MLCYAHSSGHGNLRHAVYLFYIALIKLSVPVVKCNSIYITQKIGIHQKSYFSHIIQYRTFFRQFICKQHIRGAGYQLMRENNY